MPIYRLGKQVLFPPPEFADATGIVAVGGDLSSERLLEAYRLGIFPWYSDDQPILWWSPDPRFILDLDEFHLSRSLRRTLRRKWFQVTCDSAFDDVIAACASVPRKGQNGTWITRDMRSAYLALHRLGYAHSVESWSGGELVGGIYGVSLGGAFFAESMFHTKPDASKVALASLVDLLQSWGFDFLDAQMASDHMIGLGARDIPRRTFLKRLERALRQPTRLGRWRLEQSGG